MFIGMHKGKNLGQHILVQRAVGLFLGHPVHPAQQFKVGPVQLCFQIGRLNPQPVEFRFGFLGALTPSCHSVLRKRSNGSCHSPLETLGHQVFQWDATKYPIHFVVGHIVKTSWDARMESRWVRRNDSASRAGCGHWPSSTFPGLSLAKSCSPDTERYSWAPRESGPSTRHSACTSVHGGESRHPQEYP